MLDQHNASTNLVATAGHAVAVPQTNKGSSKRKRTPARPANIRIDWALQEGRLVHVSDLRRGQAQGCVCIECAQPLTPRLGGKRRWHFAHEAGAAVACPLHSEPVRQLFEAKLHVAAVLRGLSALAFRVACPRQRRGGAPHPAPLHAWLVTWDVVEVSAARDSTKPAIVLRSRNAAVGCIDVRSSPGGAEVRTMLVATGTPWLEVVADDGLAWRAPNPLVVHRAGPQPPAVCPWCAAHDRHRGGHVGSAGIDDDQVASAARDGRLRALWEKPYIATLDGAEWEVKLFIADVVDRAGVPVRRVLLGGSDGDFVMVAATAEQVAADDCPARAMFRGERDRWTDSLRHVGLEVHEVALGWVVKAAPEYLFDTPERKAVLREFIWRQRSEPVTYGACEELGVWPNASRAEITSARRKAAKAWHPDRAPEGCAGEYTAKMQAVNAAHDVLTARLGRCDQPK